ncbi:unnamed protein product, partial [Diamesa serratosioi]
TFVDTTFMVRYICIQLDDGSILGRYLTSDSGRGIRGFMGIPFAEPPIGKLRFKAPLKKKPWKGTLIAQQDAPICTQIDIFSRSSEVRGQEDCLYLNVYAPVKNTTELLPVMVFIHGGGWIAGAASKSVYGPDYFLEHDVIYVAGNYRLGPLGFLSTEQEDCTGNFGFKDQVMLLKWIQQNIEKFGGNPESVTIFGESAGAASVNHIMMAPMAKGLFHRAISQSGTTMTSWADVPRPGLAKMRAIRLGNMMSCPTANTSLKKMIDCLRKVDAKRLTKAFEQFFEWDNDPIVIFGPVVEKQRDEEPFINDYRFYKHSLDIPWITGVTSEEGSLKSAIFINDKKMGEKLNKDWDRALPTSLYYDHLEDKKQDAITKEINDFYFNGEKFTESNGGNLTNMYSDGWFIAGMMDNLEYRLKNNQRDNTYVYLFSHKGTASWTEKVKGGAENDYGTSHADDLLYMFPMRKEVSTYFNSIPTEQDIQLTKTLVELWVNFAYTGNPTPKDSLLPKWTPAKRFPFGYLRIGNNNGESEDLLSMEKDLYPERAAFWRKLRTNFPKLTQENYKDEL